VHQNPALFPMISVAEKKPSRFGGRREPAGESASLPRLEPPENGRRAPRVSFFFSSFFLSSGFTSGGGAGDGRRSCFEPAPIARWSRIFAPGALQDQDGGATKGVLILETKPTGGARGAPEVEAPDAARAAMRRATFKKHSISFATARTEEMRACTVRHRFGIRFHGHELSSEGGRFYF